MSLLQFPHLWTSLIEASSSQAGFEIEFISVASITERMRGLLYWHISDIFCLSQQPWPALASYK